MAGKLIIHGFEQFVIGGKVDILLDSKKVGSVGRKQTAEFIFQRDTTMVVQCGINPMKSSIELKNGMLTEVQCVYNRITGKVEAEVVSATPYQATSEDLAQTQAVEHPVYTLDGGMNNILFVYEDHVVIDCHGVANTLMAGLKGEKTIYYSDISSVQYKEPGAFRGYIQFSIPGGNESKGGLADAVTDENTVLLKSTPQIISEAQKVVNFLNQKIRESKTGARTAQTVVQQTSAADELKKFKELLDSGVITQEEFDAKKKQLLGL